LEKKYKFNNLKKFFKEKIGPGVLTGASDDDPAGIVTYSIAGVKGGLDFLWTPLFTLPLMYYVQEACARIALVTQKSLIILIKNLYGFKISFFIAVLMFFANTFNLAADLNALAMILNYIFPYIPLWLYSLLISLILSFIIIAFSYQKFANLIKYFIFFLFSYIAVCLFININWNQVFESIIIPEIKLNKEWLLIFLAILGTTISPYLFFWQEEEELEEIRENKNQDFKKNIRLLRVDTFLGMLISNVIMFFIILATGVVLNPLGIYDIKTIDDLIKILEPLFGKYAFILFSLGIISSGLIAIPILAICSSYILSELFNLEPSLNKNLKEGFIFYLFIIGSILLSNIFNFLGISPIKFLFYSAIIYGFITPLLIFFILKISNNYHLMGNYKNDKISNLFLILNLLIFTTAIIFYFFS
jgi:Mn2+/Fe2+ NRAMP family transporter